MSTHDKISRFGSVPRNRFSCACIIAPCGMEYTFQSTGRIGYLEIPFSKAFMWVIWTVGLNTAFAFEQHCVHYLPFVVGVLTTGHQREGVFAMYEKYLDTDFDHRPSARRRLCYVREVSWHWHCWEEICLEWRGRRVIAPSSWRLDSPICISFSRQHEFNWAPESRDVKGWCSTQRPSSILV